MPNNNVSRAGGDASASGQSILPGIEHILVLMFENRSFDNVLGGLYPDKSQTEYNGLTGTETNPINPCQASSDQIQVFQGPTDLDTMVMPYPDPGELFNDMNNQIFGCCSPADYASRQCPDTGTENMQGFVQNYMRQPPAPGPVNPIGQNIMQYYAPGPDGNVPISSGLAQAYAVSDQWHASGPVQTLANRNFVHCATPGTYIDENGDIVSATDNPDITGSYYDPDGAVDEKSVFQLVDEASRKGDWPWPNRTAWKVYYHDWPLAALVKYVDDHWATFSDGNVYEIMDSDGGLFSDLSNGELPTYSFIEPRYTNIWGGIPNSNHPGGSDTKGNPPAISICEGELLLQQIYTALYNAPNNLFQKTLFIVIYDEHGGLYDHVVPPPAVSPFLPNKVGGFQYDRYGVRVPAIFINPFIQPQTIFRPQSGPHPFDHTSVISTLCAQFGLEGSLTPRDASAPTLSGLMNTTTPNPFTPADLPTLTCPPPVGPTVAPESLRTKAAPHSVGLVIEKAVRSPKNQAHVARLKVPPV